MRLSKISTSSSYASKVRSFGFKFVTFDAKSRIPDSDPDPDPNPNTNWNPNPNPNPTTDTSPGPNLKRTES